MYPSAIKNTKIAEMLKIKHLPIKSGSAIRGLSIS